MVFNGAGTKPVEFSCFHSCAARLHERFKPTLEQQFTHYHNAKYGSTAFVLWGRVLGRTDYRIPFVRCSTRSRLGASRGFYRMDRSFWRVCTLRLSWFGSRFNTNGLYLRGINKSKRTCCVYHANDFCPGLTSVGVFLCFKYMDSTCRSRFGRTLWPSCPSNLC